MSGEQAVFKLLVLGMVLGVFLSAIRASAQEEKNQITGVVGRVFHHQPVRALWERVYLRGELRPCAAIQAHLFSLG